jgi:hypothetical protein
MSSQNNSPDSPHNNNLNNSNNNSNNNTTPSTNNDDFVTLTLNETLNQQGNTVVNKQGVTVNGNGKTETTFRPTDISNNMANINEDLIGLVISNYDDELESTGDPILVAKIKDLAGKIKCDSFHGKGSIDDYQQLFLVASQIASDTKQMQLDVDISGFNEFGNAADELSALFINFTRRLENVNIINDTIFLTAVASALQKVYNLSEVFGRFKETILLTSTVKIPKSAHDVSILLQGVMNEVSCAMGYINNFVNPDATLVKAQLSDTDKAIIANASSTIEHWNVLCEQGVSIALSNSPDIQFIKVANTTLSQQSTILRNTTAALRAKIALLQ